MPTRKPPKSTRGSAKTASPPAGRATSFRRAVRQGLRRDRRRPGRHRARCPGCCRADCCRRHRRCRRPRGCCRGCRRDRRHRRPAPAAARAPRASALGQLLADVGQHDGRQDRQQLLEQSAVGQAAAGQCRRDLVAVVAAEDVGDDLDRLRFWSTWSTLTPPSRRPLAACVVTAASSLLESMSAAATLCCRPPTSAGTSVRMALFTSPSSTPNLLAISCTGISLKSSSRPAMTCPPSSLGCCTTAIATLAAAILSDRRSARR